MTTETFLIIFNVFFTILCWILIKQSENRVKRHIKNLYELRISLTEEQIKNSIKPDIRNLEAQLGLLNDIKAEVLSGILENQVLLEAKIKSLDAHITKPKTKKTKKKDKDSLSYSKPETSNGQTTNE